MQSSGSGHGDPVSFGGLEPQQVVSVMVPAACQPVFGRLGLRPPSGSSTLGRGFRVVCAVKKDVKGDMHFLQDGLMSPRHK